MASRCKPVRRGIKSPLSLAVKSSKELGAGTKIPIPTLFCAKAPDPSQRREPKKVPKNNAVEMMSFFVVILFLFYNLILKMMRNFYCSNIFISVLRFCFLPSSLSLVAMGFASP